MTPRWMGNYTASKDSDHGMQNILKLEMADIKKVRAFNLDKTRNISEILHDAKGSGTIDLVAVNDRNSKGS